MKLEPARSLAQTLLDQLSSACVRIEIKGSIVRRKADVDDIDLVCLPSIGTYSVPVYEMFTTATATVHQVNHLEDAIVTLIAGGDWEFDPIVKRNGPRLKRLRHVATGLPADIAIVDARRWGCIATIRTGPKDFSKALVKHAHRQAAFVQDGLLHRHVPEFDSKGDVQDCPAAERCRRIVETPEERDVFTALGLPWIEPHKRTVNLFYATLPRGMVR
jgi:DNA polymerase/3'-5' exonuclease PolX